MTAPTDPEVTPEPSKPQEWRAGSNYPAWMQGKTADEIAQMTMQLGGAVERLAQQPTQWQQAPQTPIANLDDDAYVDGRSVKGYINQVAQQFGNQTNPMITQSMDMAASACLGQVEREYAAEFAKYRPEIMRELAGIPKSMWNLDNLRKVVKFVRADHVDDLAQERAQALLAQQSPTLRAGSGGHAPSGSQADARKFDELPARYRQTMDRMGINWETVQEFCRTNGEDPKTWIENASKMGDSLIVEGTNGRRTTTT